MIRERTLEEKNAYLAGLRIGVSLAEEQGPDKAIETINLIARTIRNEDVHDE